MQIWNLTKALNEAQLGQLSLWDLRGTRLDWKILQLVPHIFNLISSHFKISNHKVTNLIIAAGLPSNTASPGAGSRLEAKEMHGDPGFKLNFFEVSLISVFDLFIRGLLQKVVQLVMVTMKWQRLHEARKEGSVCVWICNKMNGPKFNQHCQKSNSE